MTILPPGLIMPEIVRVCLNGRSLEVRAGTTLAAALYAAEQFTFRRSEGGQGRGALCGMGICFECRVTIDQQPNCRSCQIIVRDGMTIETA
jgi:aerobic-type carbon monoxide dehydrogenase small subunit (CoxS/CutS family)